jgi:Heparinase II/III-like protein/Heparinase II/III N-terminus
MSLSAKLRRILANPAESKDRARQEIRNLTLLWSPPKAPVIRETPLPGLPSAETCAAAARDTPFAMELGMLAREIRSRRIPLLGLEPVDLGKDIRWRRDPVNGIETDAVYFRRIPYLDSRKAGDHKLIWEISRCQFLVVLAQDFAVNGNHDSLQSLQEYLESWLGANPFQRGMNWTSALEVAFRALSWMWVWHLAGPSLDPAFRQRLSESLYRHGHHLDANLSRYFSPNTHLLGEAVALHALGRVFPEFPESEHWRQTGDRVVRAQMLRQVWPDGAHFEQSTYYQVYAIDMFLLYSILSGNREPEWVERLEKMGEYLQAVMGPSRRLPYFGDDDGGRMFHPYGRRDEFGRATLACLSEYLDRCDFACTEQDRWPMALWWLGPRPATKRTHSNLSSQMFPNCGMCVLRSGPVHLVFDAGPFGEGSAGHSHADTLSFTLSVGDREILIDPGTYTYVGDRDARERFRSTAAHNTITINGRSQGQPAQSAFAWESKPECKLTEWDPERLSASGECRYEGFLHRRSLRIDGSVILIEDRVDGPNGIHELAQFWHLADEAAARLIHTGDQVERIPGVRSRAYGQVEDSGPVLVRRERVTLPAVWQSRIELEL